MKAPSRRTLFVHVAVFASCLSFCALAQADKNSLAVMKFTTKAGGGTHYWHDASWDLGWGLAEMLTTGLVETGKFKVLERQNIQDVLSEQDFGESGRIAQGTEAKIGQVLGATLLVYGTVNEFEYSEKGTGGGVRVKRFKVGGKAAEAHIAMDVRVVDATTSEILFSKTFVEKSSRKGFNVGYSGGDFGGDLSSFKKTPLGETTRIAIEKAAAAIAETLGDMPVKSAPAWKGTLLLGDDGSLIIKAGKNEGLATGDRLEVFKPKTVNVGGETLSVGEERVGMVSLVHVGEAASVATAVEGSGFKSGYIVKKAP